MKKGVKSSKKTPVSEGESLGSPPTLRVVRVCSPEATYTFKPEGWTATLFLRPISWTTIQRLMSEVAVELGFSMERIINPDPVARKKQNLIAAPSEKNSLFSQLLSLKVSQEAVVGWDNKVLGENDQPIPYKKELLEYVADPILLQQIGNDVMTRSNSLLDVEKKS